MKMQREECLHDFHTGFVPTANREDDYIIVTRNSPLISCVSRQLPGQYRIEGGSFIGGGASHDATPEEAAEYLARSPHWAHLMRLTLGDGLGRRSPCFGDQMSEETDPQMSCSVRSFRRLRCKELKTSSGFLLGLISSRASTASFARV